VKRLLAGAALAAAVTFGPSIVNAESLPPVANDCHGNYYLQDGGEYDRVTTACRDLQAPAPGFMQRACAWLAGPPTGTMQWACGNWVDCNWLPTTPNKRLSTVSWLVTSSSKWAWTVDSWLKVQVATDTKDPGC
jgi:hypothetical protein